MMMDAGVLRIEKHDDKLVFRNPGSLRLPIEQIYEGGVSHARNPKIQNMFRMVGYGENLGSGFPLILEAWKQSGWGEPKLENKIDLDEVELDLPLKKITRDNSDESKEKSHLDEEKSNEKSREKSNEKGREKNNEKGREESNEKGREKSNEKGKEKSKEKIISIIRDNPKVTQFELSNILNVSEKAIEKHIKKLRENGIIRRVGPDKGGYWEIIKKDATP